MSVLAKRVMERPAALLVSLRTKSAKPDIAAPPPAAREISEDVERYKSPYITYNKSDPLNLDSLLNEEEKMIR